MPTIRPTPNGKRFSVTIRNRLLPKPLYYTFDDLPSAEAYAEQCEKWLAAGIVPTAMAAEPTKARKLVGPSIRAWINTGEPSKSDIAILDLLFDELGKLERSQLTYRWADEWVRGMKRVRNLTPGTIRKRVGALSEMLAWEIQTSPDLGLPNPLTSLPRGYSTYNEVDAEAARKAGMEPKVDVQRDRRLAVGEERQILAALAGEKRVDRERPLVSDDLPTLRTLFRLIIGTGVRLREAYTTRASQIDLASRRYRVKSTKQWRGRVKFRDVPMTREVHELLTEHMASRPFWSANDLVFPFWDGDEAKVPDVTNRLSKRFKTLF